MRGSREISLVPSLHRASTDALMIMLMPAKTMHVQTCVCFFRQLLFIVSLP